MNYGSRQNLKAFTLVELIIAMVMTVIISSAVIGLSYAASQSYENAERASTQQSRIRTASLKIADILKCSLLVCRTGDDGLGLWLEDTNGDKAVNLPELLYVLSDSSGNISLVSFEAEGYWAQKKLSLAKLCQADYEKELECYFSVKRTVLLEDCTNIRFFWNKDAPNTNLISITFDIDSEPGKKTYEIAASKMGPAEPFIY